MFMKDNYKKFQAAFDYFFANRKPSPDECEISIATFGPNNHHVQVAFHPYAIPTIENGEKVYSPVMYGVFLIGHFLAFTVVRNPVVAREIVVPGPGRRIWPRNDTFVLWPDQPYVPIEFLEVMGEPPMPYSKARKGELFSIEPESGSLD